MSYFCPICDKAGLPDYTKKSVVCPQCNSDLKAFLLLRSISEPKKILYFGIAVIGLALFSLFFFGFYMLSNTERKELVAVNKVLNDSILFLHNASVFEKTVEERHQVVENKEIVIKYIVRKDDFPYKIAQFFYGDGMKYKKIEADNALIQPYVLKVGQTLIIKIPQE